MNVAVIGFGRFGRLAARYLSEDFSVGVYDPGASEKGIRECGSRPLELSDLGNYPLVIIAVPISVFRDCIESLAPYIAVGSMVADVCSVKMLPVSWMLSLLPENIEILATHPMFGPDSARHSLSGRKIALHPVRVDPLRYRRIRRYLSSRKLDVIEASPEQHDRQIAVSLSLTHFIGRALSAFGAPELEIDTEGYRRLRHILGVVQNDTWQLFQDMHRYNPFASELRDRFVASVQEIHEELGPSLEIGDTPAVS